MIEVTIDGIKTLSSTQVENKFGSRSMMVDSWDSDSFVVMLTNKGGIDFVVFSRETIIDIEPLTIDIGMFELHIFTDIGFLSSEVISTRRIGWFFSGIPRVEE